MQIIVFFVVLLLAGGMSALEVAWAKGVIENNPWKTGVSASLISLAHVAGLYLAFVQDYPVALVALVVGDGAGSLVAVKRGKPENES